MEQDEGMIVGVFLQPLPLPIPALQSPHFFVGKHTNTFCFSPFSPEKSKKLILKMGKIRWSTFEETAVSRHI